MNAFLNPSSTSLKICGVTRLDDAKALIQLDVHAIGVNFWPNSKRYLNAKSAKNMLESIAGKIVRVGVFVNAEPELPMQMLESKLIDIAQFHGDESVEYCSTFANKGLAFIKALGVSDLTSLDIAEKYGAIAILLDTPAPGVYGGTGETFDWAHARNFVGKHPKLPMLLAGGITPDNAEDAILTVRPAALDIASGAEISPGIKDLDKVQKLMDIIKLQQS